ncbi:MAG: hypothetical protein V4584_02915 [Verrucomicrobiota bacterium]
MSNSTPLGRDSRNLSDITSRSGPEPHEDLTIGEHIETMRVRDEHRPGQWCFLNEHGEKRWIAESEVQRFVRKNGAEHPSNYLSIKGYEWQRVFFNSLARADAAPTSTSL